MADDLDAIRESEIRDLIGDGPDWADWKDYWAALRPLVGEIDRLRAALARAQADALREAASAVPEDYRCDVSRRDREKVAAWLRDLAAALDPQLADGAGT